MLIAVMRLPPTACAIECRSVVLVTTRSFCAGGGAGRAATAAPMRTRRFIGASLSERMRPVRSDGDRHLRKQTVHALADVRPKVFVAQHDLRELAGEHL